MTEDRIYKVYMHTNIINNKKYIGITQQAPEKRWRKDGKGYVDNKYFYRSIQKYGWDNFIHEIVLCNLTKVEADLFEIEMIKYYKTTNKRCGYNISCGGSSGDTETFNKISKTLTGKKLTEEHKAKIGKANKNFKMSKEQKEYLRKINTGRKWTQEHREKVKGKFNGKNNPMYGISINQKKIICIETGEIFDSLKSAASKIKVDPSCISRACNKGISTKELHFAFYEKYISGDFFIAENNNTRKIICLETKEIFKSIAIASKSMNITRANIEQCLNKRSKSANNFHFVYYEKWLECPDKNKHILAKRNCKAIICVELNMEFESIASATRHFNFGKNQIYRVLDKERTLGGYHWITK